MINKEIFERIDSYSHRDVEKKDELLRIMTSNIYYTLGETIE